jgi:methionyl-tRNA formyltransferase
MKQQAIVMGKGTLAIRIAQWFLDSPNYELIHVVPVMPEPSWTESLARWADDHAIAYPSSGHYRDIPAASDPNHVFDLVFSVFYDKIIKADFIARCRRILNLHNGPLPRYRGVSPINWALKNGETKHGVTIHEITPGIDDGPIVAQVDYSIYPAFDEVIDVYRRAIEYGWVLFQQTMPLIDRIEPQAQDPGRATYYSAHQNHLLGDRRGFTRHESLNSIDREHWPAHNTNASIGEHHEYPVS